jgi:hypothetical protein
LLSVIHSPPDPETKARDEPGSARTQKRVRETHTVSQASYRRRARAPSSARGEGEADDDRADHSAHTHMAVIPSGVQEHVVASPAKNGLQLGSVATQPSGYETSEPASPAWDGPPWHAPSPAGIGEHPYVVVAAWSHVSLPSSGLSSATPSAAPSLASATGPPSIEPGAEVLALHAIGPDAVATARPARVESVARVRMSLRTSHFAQRKPMP